MYKNIVCKSLSSFKFIYRKLNDSLSLVWIELFYPNEFFDTYIDLLNCLYSLLNERKIL